MTSFARNKVELAKALGISRRGLQRFYELKNHPESKSDGRLNVKEWASFISANSSRVTTGTPVIPLSKKDSTRITLMEIEIQRAKVKLDRESSDYLKELEAILKGRIEALRGRIERLCRVELPPTLEMRPARQVQKLLVEGVRRTWNEWCGEAADRVAA